LSQTEAQGFLCHLSFSKKKEKRLWTNWRVKKTIFAFYFLPNGGRSGPLAAKN
jgi:hypothetical protein